MPDSIINLIKNNFTKKKNIFDLPVKYFFKKKINPFFNILLFL